MARIWEIAKPEHGRLLLSVVLAVLGVVSGIVPFICAAKIISGMISGNRESVTCRKHHEGYSDELLNSKTLP